MGGEKLLIRGDRSLRLRGEVRMSGAKNAVLPAIAASLLTAGEIRLTNVPRVKDVETILTLIAGLGGSTRGAGDAVAIRVPEIRSDEASYELVRAMRASILVLGPLVARFGKAVVALPGGCAIGSRPIDLHIAGLQKLGATISLEHGYIRAEAGRLRGAEIFFEKKTVTGTENLLMAAALAKGETVLGNCAREPEVVDLAELLNKMGAKIDWIDDETARIRGVKELGGAAHAIIPDRIETGTFLVAGALTSGDFLVRGVVPEHVRSVVDKLRASGAYVETEGEAALRVVGAGEVRAQDITTSPYPGFPTDMQAQFMVLLTQAAGTSIITETIFDRRYAHVNELVRLGAAIEVQGDKAIVKGKTPLSGAEVVATDLRASAALVLAGLVAAGETTVTEIEHLDRGYERIEEKLRGLGASIEDCGMTEQTAADCLFCRIVRGEIPAKVVFDDERLFAFEDVRPMAPVHFLVVPKSHFASLNEAPDGAGALLGEILLRAREIARAKGIGETGYRIVLNTAADAGQTVFHIHFHILGGRHLEWPPG